MVDDAGGAADLFVGVVGDVAHDEIEEAAFFLEKGEELEEVGVDDWFAVDGFRGGGGRGRFGGFGWFFGSSGGLGLAGGFLEECGVNEEIEGEDDGDGGCPLRVVGGRVERVGRDECGGVDGDQQETGCNNSHEIQS